MGFSVFSLVHENIMGGILPRAENAAAVVKRAGVYRNNASPAL